MRVKNFTDQDALVLEEIKRCGFLGVDIKQGFYLSSNMQISKYRFKRLISLGKIKPLSNTLFESAPPQQYVLASESVELQ